MTTLQNLNTCELVSLLLTELFR